MKRALTRAMVVRSLGAAVVVFSSVLSAGASDSFPTKPVRVIVNTAPGGLTDLTTRLVAQKMGEQLGQAVVVENRAGGDGLLGIRAVKDAPADGYTLLASAGTIAIQPAVKKEPGYDLAQDFTGIGPMIRFPLLMVVGSKQPDKTLEEFIARAKANPRDMSYASAGVGTTTHVGAAMFLQRTGLSLLHVPYKGNGAAMTDVMAGRVSMVFEAYGSSASKVKDGTLRALGVTSTARLPSLPDVPTIAEQGIPDFSYYLYLGLLSPAGTPKEVVQRLSNALQSALSSTELKERFRNEGSEAMIMSSGEFDEFLKQDVARMSKLAAELGLPKE
jgi:tripartite-type tricarboxylate transporter receptor subunit TctC